MLTRAIKDMLPLFCHISLELRILKSHPKYLMQRDKKKDKKDKVKREKLEKHQKSDGDSTLT